MLILYVFIINICAGSDRYEAYLDPFDHKHCITSCEKGLKEDVDRVILSGYAKMGQPLISLSIQWKKDPQENYKDLKIIPMHECTGIQTALEISCTGDDEVYYEVYLNITAKEELSQAMMILNVHFSDWDMVSEDIVLPIIYKSSNVSNIETWALSCTFGTSVIIVIVVLIILYIKVYYRKKKQEAHQDNRTGSSRKQRGVPIPEPANDMETDKQNEEEQKKSK